MGALVDASWHELLPILRETAVVWSAGLALDHYKNYTWRQLNHPWARRNMRYVIFEEKQQALSSAKLFNSTFAIRDKLHPMLALRALFTPEAKRGHGYAKALLNAVIDRARSDGYHGVYLFSDIGEDLYLDAGFEPLSAIDFSMELDGMDSELALDPRLQLAELKNFSADEHTSQLAFHLDPGISAELKDDLLRCYSKWLRTQSYGLVRDQGYILYKLGREAYLNEYSDWIWPALEITTLKYSTSDFGYAITEHGDGTLRIFEIVGSPTARELLWNHLLNLAMEEGIWRVRGWESVVSDFGPTFRWSHSRKILATEREWARPMFLPLDQSVLKLSEFDLCPLLELDF